MSDVITVPTPDGDMPAHRWLPPSGTGPGILLLQEIFGISEYVRARAADLAKEGYVVLAPELYWRIPGHGIDESAPDVLERAMSLMGRIDWTTAVADARAALDHLHGASEATGGVGIVGFCFGGGLAFNVAAEDAPDALVSYYGSALPDLLDLAPRVRAPSLHHFGTADAYLPLETVERVRDAVTWENARVEFELYEGAGHAFDNPAPMFHHAEASAQAWPRTVEFLAEHVRRSAV